MTKPDVATAVRQVVVDELRTHKPASSTELAAITDGALLGEGGLGISSLLLLRIFVKLEESLGFQFEDAAVAGAKFQRVGDLVSFVSKAVHDQRAAAPESR